MASPEMRARSRLAIMTCILLSIGVYLLSSLQPGSALAQVNPPQSHDLTGVAAIQDRGRIIVAMTRFDNPPFYGGDGEAFAGIDVTLAKRLGDALGVKVVFDREAPSFDEVVNRVVQGKADIAISKLSRTYKRTAQIAFSDPYLRLRHALVFNRLRLAQLAGGRDIAGTVRSFNGTLGVIGHSSFAGFARQRFPDAKVLAFPRWEDAVRAVIEGRVDAAYRDEFEIRKIAVDNRDATLKLRTVAISDAKDSIAMAVSWDAPRLLAIANQVIDNSPQQLTVEDLIERYRVSIGAISGE